MPIRFRACFLAILALLAVTSCAESPADEAGSQAGSPGDAPRLAVLSPASAIVLRDLGREDAIVARHGFDLVLDKSIPVAGDQTGLDYETLLRVDPDVVILEASAQDIPPKLAELADANGWEVLELPYLNLSDIVLSVTSLDIWSSGTGDATESGDALLDRFLEALFERPSACVPLGRTLLLTWTDPVGVMGPGSFHFELLTALGATPIPDEGAPYITLDTEDVLRLDPDTIVLLMPGREGGDLRDALGPLGDVGLRAAEENRVILINHPLALTPSTALIEVADALAEAAGAMP